MKAFVVLAVVGVASAATSFLVPYSGATVGVAAALPPVSYASQFHAQDELGQVNYGFAIPGQAKNEIRDAFGNVAGVYTYIDADNKPVHVEYTAGVNGVQFRSNNLPVGPDGSNLVAPEPVKDTPEVVAARSEFLEAYNAAVAAATTVAPAEDPVTEALAAVEVTDAPVKSPKAVPEAAAPEAPVNPPQPVLDTPEVAKAKVEFQAAYDAAAAAAEAAPDFDLDGSLSTYSGQLSAVDGALSPLYSSTIPFGAPVQVFPSLGQGPVNFV